MLERPVRRAFDWSFIFTPDRLFFDTEIKITGGTEKMAIGEKRPTKRPDLDNIIKTIDALNGLAFDDDSQIVEVVAEKYYSQESRLEITINSL